MLAIGKIVKAIGIRGDVVIQPMTGDIARFKKLKRVSIGTSEQEARETGVSSTAIGDRGIRMKLAGTDDRTVAESLVGSLLFVDEKDAIRLPKGTFFVHDIIGLRVVDQDGMTIGTVQDVLKYPANDVYIVRNGGREIMVPAVKEFIANIDVAAHTMHVNLIEGMLDEEPEDVKENDAD